MTVARSLDLGRVVLPPPDPTHPGVRSRPGPGQPHHPRGRGADPHRPRLHLREAAADLYVSLRTIETHVNAALRKLQLSSRRELARGAHARDLH